MRGEASFHLYDYGKLINQSLVDNNNSYMYTTVVVVNARLYGLVRFGGASSN